MASGTTCVITTKEGNKEALPFVFTGGKWVQCIPNVHNGAEWKNGG